MGTLVEVAEWAGGTLIVLVASAVLLMWWGSRYVDYEKEERHREIEWE